MGKRPKYNRTALLEAAISLEVQRSAQRDQHTVSPEDLERTASAVYSQVYDGGVARRVPRHVQASVHRAAQLIAEKTLEDTPAPPQPALIPEQRVGVYATASEVAWLGRFGMYDEEDTVYTIPVLQARHLAEDKQCTFNGVNLGDHTAYLPTN